MENKLLQSLTDKELFDVIFSAGYEIKRRIIALLNKSEITCYTFDLPEGDLPIIEAFDYDEGSTEITVKSIGYTIDKYGSEITSSEACLFVVDTNERMWAGDDAIVSGELWDVYKELTSSIKC